MSIACPHGDFSKGRQRAARWGSSSDAASVRLDLIGRSRSDVHIATARPAGGVEGAEDAEGESRPSTAVSGSSFGGRADTGNPLWIMFARQLQRLGCVCVGGGFQTRFSSVRAKATARSSGMRPMTRWLRRPLDHEPSDRSPRRSERIGVSGARLAMMQNKTGSPEGST